MTKSDSFQGANVQNVKIQNVRRSRGMERVVQDSSVRSVVVLMAGAFVAFAMMIVFASHARASTAEKISQVCGLSDTIYEYIAKAAGEKSKARYSLTAALGSARHMIVYNDESWILTLEFLSQGDIGQDRTCIIARGELATQELATDIMKGSEWIGPQAPASAPSKQPQAAPTSEPKRLPNGKIDYQSEA